MSKFFKIKKAKRIGEQESEDKVLASLEKKAKIKLEQIDGEGYYLNGKKGDYGDFNYDGKYKQTAYYIFIDDKGRAHRVWEFTGKINNASLKKKAADIVPDKYRTILINAIDENLVDPKQIAKDLAHYISEEDCEDFCRIYEIKDISELE